MVRLRTSDISYPGLWDIVSASATISAGVKPSVALLTCYRGQPEKKPGKLKMTYSRKGHRVVWEDCVIAKATEQSGGGGRTTTYVILDRRWRWKHGRPVDLLCNVRKPNGDIVEGTEMSPREIVESLLWVHLGERAFDIDDLPNDTRPFIDWICAAPDGALNKIITDLGCTIVPEFQKDDVTTFAVRRLMVGDKPPGMRKLVDGKMVGLGLLSSAGSTFGSAARPTRIRVCGGLVKYQSKFKLEAVGLDVDDKIKPIAKLSYRPKLGFGPGKTVAMSVFNDPDKKNRTKELLAKHIALANSTVYRWYRIAELAEGGWPQDVIALDGILPLLPGLVETQFNKDGIETEKKPFVEGVFRTSSMDDVVTEPCTRLVTPFVIMADKGVVVFPEPVVSHSPLMMGVLAEVQAVDPSQYPERDGDKPAVLRLTVAFNVQKAGFGKRDITSREDMVEHLGPGLEPGGKKLFHTIRRPEIVLTRRSVYDKSPGKCDLLFGPINQVDNKATIDLEMDVHIEKARQQFLSDVGSSVTYRGLVPIKMNGAIRQITYSISVRGTSTRASWNSKHDPKAPDDGLLKIIENIENLERIVEFVERDRLNWERVTHFVES